ncbi:MAG: cell division protein FtsL [Zoogloeaceae bacterium]|jgi:cell division protein FtsL|nr:cell division protein FtsL [Zoogloeaceae bacterium]
MRTGDLFLLLLIVASALSLVAARRQEIRLLRQVQVEEEIRIQLQQEYRELMLDRSLLSGHSRIERLARTQLGMVEPVLNLAAPGERRP